MANVLHVAPISDLVGHDASTEEADCACSPQTRPVKHDDGSTGWLIVHHSLDAREHSERQ